MVGRDGEEEGEGVKELDGEIDLKRSFRSWKMRNSCLSCKEKF